jgi:hypothetical protein
LGDLISAFRRMRIRMGDAGWAAVQPARSKLHAGSRRLMRWRRRRADALWYWAASLRVSWQRATRRRRAAVGVLAVLPIAMASGVTAMLLPAGGDPRAGPSQERTAGESRPKQKDVKPATASARGERPKPGRAATGSTGAGTAAVTAAQGLAVTPGPAASEDGSGVTGGRPGGESPGGGSWGGDAGDSPARGPDRSRGVERRTSPAPAPPTRTPAPRVPAGRDGKRSAPSPGPPAAQPPAPRSQAPAAPPASTGAPVTEPAPPVTEPDADFEEERPGDGDGDRDGGHGPGRGEGPQPPPDRGGGNDEDHDP